MGLRKNKNKASEEPAQVEQGPTPYEIGLHGSVEALYQADKAAKADIAAKEAVFEKHNKKGKGIALMFYSFDKNLRLLEAYQASEKVPYKIHQELQEGAFEAFLEERPENLQEILSNPQPFRAQYQGADDLVIRTLIELTGKIPDPETLLLALAKVAEDKRQDILDNTLYTLVWRYNNIEAVASALLGAGAKAGHDLSKILAAAFIKQPDSIIAMLRENGANFDDALATMRADPKLYGNSADRIEHLQFKEETQARIRNLEHRLAETTRELTGTPQKQGAAEAAPPAPAETAAPRTRLLKIAATPPMNRRHI